MLKVLQPAIHNCETCPAHAQLSQMGLKLEKFDRVLALAGNPNTGKSSVFNALTGLKQHTGNWPGKTVTRAEGGFAFGGINYKLVDLPGTYSLLSASQDEEVSRDFILFGKPDCTIVVADATALERNLNLALQVMEITSRVVVCVNLMDEARRKGIRVDVRSLGFREEAGFRNVDKVRAYARPTLIIHAEYDHIIPFSDGQAMYDASPAPQKKLVKIPGANHNDIFARGFHQYMTAIQDFVGILSDSDGY